MFGPAARSKATKIDVGPMTELMLFEDNQLPNYGDELDFWSTPAWAAEAIFPALQDAAWRRSGRVQVIEPAAGNGALFPLALSLQPQSISPVELGEWRHAELEAEYGWLTTPVRADFLTLDVQKAFPGLMMDDPSQPLCFVMNPPFTKPRPTIGREFIEKCLLLAEPSKGIVCSLLPLDWACGVAWGQIHDAYPASLYPLRRRPEFDGENTGKRPCAWFIWDLLHPKREWGIVG